LWSSRKHFILLFVSAAVFAVLALPVAAGTLTGVVRNGTTGAAVANTDVVLLQLQGGMEAVANTKTDPQGRYRIEHPGIGRQPMLLRVNYHGINFHQSVPPGRDTADVEVFEPTPDASVVQVATRLIVVQPNSGVLLVGEEYTVQNSSNPPKAYYKADGNFEFQISEGGELAQVSAWGPSGMPVVQGTIDRGSRRYAIAFAFRPGQSGVRLSYHIPYGSNRAAFRVPSPYAAGRTMLIAPPSMQVVSAGFQPAGTEQGWSVYAREAVPAGEAFEISISGTAPPPLASDQQGQETQGRDAARPEGAIQAMPARLDSLKWVLLGGFAALFFLGAIYLWRRPVGAPAIGAAAPVSVGHSRRNKSKGADFTGVSGAVPEVDRSLDELKDTLFRLELRRQAGTISEEDYARERGRAEKVLRDLVKG
jgi:hypothetical protein